MIVCFLISLFGLLSVNHSLTKTFNCLVPFAHWPFYGTASLTLIVTGVTIYLQQSWSALLLVFGLVHLANFLFKILYKQHLLKKIQYHSVYFLDITILLMKSGKSLRGSLNEASTNIDAFYRPYFHEITLGLQNSKLKISEQIPFLQILIADLTEIENSGVRVIDQVNSLRQQIKTELDLCRKSKAVTTQGRSQAYLLSFIYLCMLIFVGKKFGFAENISVFICSGALFLIGLLGIHLITRLYKWKI